jgi:fermentation-respiration switch protein FrsA (DUF1100 family)
MRVLGSLLGSAALAAIAVLPSFGEGAPALAPTWEGVLDTGAMKLRMALHVAGGSGGALTATIDSLDQGAMGLPVDEVAFDGSRLHLGMKKLRAQYDAVLDTTGTELAGQWKQGGATLALRFKAVQAIAMPRRPQEPTPPFPYDAVDVAFPSRQAGVTLAGTLTTPRGSPRAPAVILLTGSGPQDRNETIFGHKPFLVLADHLTRAGIAVLRFDDRGVGGSSAGPEGATSRDFAEDAWGAIAFVRRQPTVDPGAIGLLGHSEGGLIATIAASSGPGVAFVVMLAGPGLSGAEILERQTADVMRSSGASEEQIASAVAVNRKIYAAALEEKDASAAAARIRSLLAESGIPESNREAQAAQVASPWFRFFLGYDPAPDIRKLGMPVLALNGEKDVQVAAGPNLDAIRKALEAGGNTDHETVVMPGLNHLFQKSATGAVSEYGTIEQTLDPAVLQKVSSWILAHAGKR